MVRVRPPLARVPGHTAPLPVAAAAAAVVVEEEEEEEVVVEVEMEEAAG